jgi:hypothetical protein
MEKVFRLNNFAIHIYCAERNLRKKLDWNIKKISKEGENISQNEELVASKKL